MDTSRTTLAFLALFAFVPILHYAGMSAKLGVRVEAVMVYYFWGVIGGMILWTGWGRGGLQDFLPTPQLLLALVIGLTMGAGGNIALFRALDGADNPGTYISIVNANAAIVFMTAPFVAWMWPELTSGGTVVLSKLMYVCVIGLGIMGLVR